MDIDALKASLASTSTLRPHGKVKAVTGLSLRASLPGGRVGDVVLVRRRGQPLEAEIVGFVEGEVVAMPLGSLDGVGPDDPVESLGTPLQVSVGPGMLGRVLDGLGRPLGEPLGGPLERVPVDRAPPAALERRAVDAGLATGVRAIDGLMTLGVGQRVGLFAGSGVGKSTLLGAIARGTSADVVVVALVGERGREVNEFLEQALGEAGLARSVVVIATSDAPALERLKAAQVATAIAEYFRDQGQSVMLLVDSVTRFARAQREVGLAAGEPPARRGYPPSVFAMLPRLLERSGQGVNGSITAIYTVLVEGGDMDEPIADEVRGILDGHIVMDRKIAARGHYPAIDVPGSLSRVMPQVVEAEHLSAAARVRSLLGAFEEKRDLIALGAYSKGSDALVDRAIAAQTELTQFLQQAPKDVFAFDECVRRLAQIAQRYR
ncbi:MAG: FliI/YscN family ATPase [Polyangiaceae bacterium]|nr:FliI/YscN family ATPase [Myxococcales bacterium]MCB9589096.1 FliI/YscN family ATPase [Polyangiaceae bacterium]